MTHPFTHRSFVQTIGEMLDLIDPALAGIEEGGSEESLKELEALLRQILFDFMRLIERNPGIEAAAADLYGAAAALVRDAGIGAQPMARKLRLFREARERFRDRLAAARPSEQGTRIVWRHHELLCA